MLSLIVAMGKNNEIGLNNKMPWHLPGDLKYFKNTTMGSIIIMGRKTFEGLPNVLDGRRHIVLTGRNDYYIENENVEIVNSYEEILARYADSPEEVFIVGGASVYEIFLPFCEKLYLTHIEKEFNCDRYFPDIDYSLFLKEFQGEKIIDDNSAISYRFCVYRRKK